MRSYEEFAEEVFREADRRLTLKKKRAVIMRRYTFALASMFAIVLTGVFFLRNETAKEALEKKYNDDDIITVEPEPTTTLPVITTAPSGTEVIITTISADITDNGETTAQTTAEDEIPQPETTTATAETSGDTENNVSTTASSVHTSGQPPDKQTTTARTTFARTTTSATTEGLTEGIPTTTTVRKPSAEGTTVKTTTTTTRKYSPIVTTTTTRRTVTTTTTAAIEPEPTPEPTTTRRTTTTTTTTTTTRRTVTTTTTTTSTTTRRTVTTTTTTTSTTTRRTVTTTSTGSPGDAQTPPATSTTTAAPIIATTTEVPPPEADTPDAPIETTSTPESDETTTTAPAPSAPSGYSDIQLPAGVVGSSGNGADSVTYIFAGELPYDFEPGGYLCESTLMIDGVSYVCDAYICPGMPAEECVAVYIWDTGQWAYYAV